MLRQVALNVDLPPLKRQPIAELVRPMRQAHDGRHASASPFRTSACRRAGTTPSSSRARFAQGSYAAYKPGQWTTIRGVERMPVGNLYFAGEQCSEASQGS